MVLYFCLLRVFFITGSISQLVFSHFPFLSDTVLEDNTFLGIYPFPLGYLFYWCIIVHSTVTILCIFVMSVVTNLLAFQILFIYA